MSETQGVPFNPAAMNSLAAKPMAFHKLAQRAALKLEIIGLKHSSGRSVCAHIKRAYGLRGSKVHVLAAFEALLRAEGILS